MFWRFLIPLFTWTIVGTLQARPITISEIKFSGPEFLEFYNHTDTAIDLTGYTVIGGIDAFLVGIIEPGEYAVAVENIWRFRRDYGNSPQILGEYERRLDNDGEEIALRDPRGEVVLRIDYRIPQRGSLTVPGNWPPDLLIREHPLEFTFPDNLDLDQSEGANWRRAYRKGGTPGQGTDTDLDGLDDEWERYSFFAPDPLSPLPTDDPDEDGLDNFTEQLRGTNPRSADTDQDGLIDSHETGTGFFVSPDNTGTHPLVADTDNDGLNDGQELPTDTPSGAYATDPHNPDSDGDTHLDGAEARYLGNPTDPLVSPQAPQIMAFSSEADEIRAGQPVKLTWEVLGSASLNLDPLPEHRTSIGSPHSGISFLPTLRTTLLAPNQTWRFDHSATDFGQSWITPDFDDSSWSAGTTSFDQGNLGLIRGAPYFRTKIDLAGNLPGNRLECCWQVYDSGALYFNGNLVKTLGLNPPEGRQPNFERFPSFGDDITFTPNPLKPSTLTIAAESHPTVFDPDVYFDLSLSRLDPITGLQSYTLSATNPYGTVKQTIEVNILDDLPPLQTYPEWALANLPNQNPEFNQQADPDHDGIPNLLEFLTGSNPLAHDENPLSIKSVYYKPDERPWQMDRFAWFEFSFLRHRNPANAGLRLEESSDFINWTTLPTNFDPTNPHQPAIEVIGNQREKLTYRISKNRSPKFLRLRALTAP